MVESVENLGQPEGASSEEIVMIPKVGQQAPDICLKSHLGELVRLSDFRGKRNVVLAFFPLAWTPT